MKMLQHKKKQNSNIPPTSRFIFSVKKAKSSVSVITISIKSDSIYISLVLYLELSQEMLSKKDLDLS